MAVSPLRGHDGTVIGASKIARDISDRRRAEQALADMLAQQRDLRERLVALVASSGTLFGSPNLDDVVPGALVLAKTLLPADGYAVWRLDSVEKIWKIGASSGISDQFTQSIITSFQRSPPSTRWTARSSTPS